MKLVVSRPAAHRIREISAYTHNRHPSAALRARNELREAFALLSAHPDAGRRVRPDLRRFVLTRFPYLVYYTVDDAAGTVTIITSVHAARAEEP